MDGENTMTNEPKITDLIPVPEPKRSLVDLLEAVEYDPDEVEGAELARLPRRVTNRKVGR